MKEGLLNTAGGGGLMVESAGAGKIVELGTTALGSEELKEKDCGDGAGVSNAENLKKEQTGFFNVSVVIP